VLTALNGGYNLAVHVGHGFRNVMSVGDSSITNADALALANGNRLSNVYAIDCTSNAIDFPCIGEALIKSHGAEARLATLDRLASTSPTPGRAYQKEFFRLVFEAGVTAVGEAQAKQKVPFAGSAYFDGTHRWTQMTLLLLGDPEMRIWTAAPRTLTVIRPSTLVASDTAFSVHVETAGVPLAGRARDRVQGGGRLRERAHRCLGQRGARLPPR
jgi:hypothetical protein